MKYLFLYCDRHRISLIDCEVKQDKVIARLAWFAPVLTPGTYQLKSNAITSICQIELPDWAISDSDEPLIFLEPIELEIVNAQQQTQDAFQSRYS